MKASELIQGVNIILKYEPEAEVALDHDTMYCGGFIPEDMESVDLNTLISLGWFWEAKFDSWMTNV